MTRIAGALAAACLAGGCATAPAVRTPTLDPMQRFAEATAALYRKPLVPPIVIAAGINGEGARWDGARIYVDERFVRSPHLLALVAHELGHFVLGHDGPAPVTPEMELQATAAGVEILVRVLKLSEAAAVRLVYAHLLAAHDGGEPVLPGHRPPCEEIASLLRRFPAQRAWTARLRCATPTEAEASLPVP